MFQHESPVPRIAPGVPVEPAWSRIAAMVQGAACAVHAVHPGMPCVLGGRALDDPATMLCLEHFDVLPHLHAVAVQGIPVDGDSIPLDAWPTVIDGIRAVTSLPVWIAAVGIAFDASPERQRRALDRTMELLLGRTARLHWYTLFDGANGTVASAQAATPQAPANDMGLLNADGSERPPLSWFAEYVPAAGVCQEFRFGDPRLEAAVHWMHALGVRKVRVPVRWHDGLRRGALAWFDQLMEALAPFEVTLAFPFTTGGGEEVGAYGTFCAAMVARYAPPPTGTVHRIDNDLFRVDPFPASRRSGEAVPHVAAR